MTQSHEIDDQILALLGERDTSTDAARGRAIAAQRLDHAIAKSTRPRRIRTRPPHRLAIVATVVTLLAGGVAAASTTDLADRILGSKQPAADRIEAVRTDPRPAMTQAELVKTFSSAFVKKQIGERLTFDLSAPLVEDDRARLSARRTAEGDVCMALYLFMSYEKTEPDSWHLGAGACGSFADGWPLMDAIGAQNETGTMSYGLVADGVTQVRFIIDGEPQEATMGKGGFIWRHPDGDKPTDIEAVLADGAVVRRDLTWAYSGPPYGPPPDPKIVR